MALEHQADPSLPVRKVFISYSWTSPEHEDRVLEFATRLSNDRVHVIIDKWDLNPGHDAYQFMESMVLDPSIQRVLCVCDRMYAEKADQRKGGAGTEAQIITPHLYDSTGAAKQEKFIPIIFEYDDEGKPCRPVFLKTRVYIDLANEDKFEENYEQLLRNIHEKPALKRPPLGSLPDYLTEDDPIQVVTRGKFKRLEDALKNGKVTVSGTLRDYLREFKGLLPGLTYRIEGKPDIEYDELVLKTIDNFEPYRQEFCEIIRLLCDYGTSNQFEEILTVFEAAADEMFSYEKYPTIHAFWRVEGLAFITRDLFLNCCAMIIQAERWDDLDTICDHKFFVDRGGSEPQVRNYALFDANFTTLNEYRKRRLELNRYSILADEIHKRCTIPGIDFKDTQQVDFTLALRSALHEYPNGERWIPCTMVYTFEHDQRPLPLYARAVDQKQYNKVKRILKVKDKQELTRRYEEANKALHLQNWGWTFDKIQWRSLMNYERLPNQ